MVAYRGAGVCTVSVVVGDQTYGSWRQVFHPVSESLPTVRANDKQSIADCSALDSITTRGQEQWWDNQAFKEQMDWTKGEKKENLFSFGKQKAENLLLLITQQPTRFFGISLSAQPVLVVWRRSGAFGSKTQECPRAPPSSPHTHSLDLRCAKR